MTLLPPELLDSRTYDFNVLRYLLEGVWQEGVFGATDHKMVAGSTGLRLTARAGRGVIQADTGTRNGLYHQVNDADVVDAITLDPADPSNPRVDTVWLATADSTDLNTAGDVAAYGVTKGNAVAGAQAATPGAANYRAGAAAGPPLNAMHVADVLVPAGFTGPLVADTHIIDRRRRARGIASRTLVNNSTFSTLGTTLTELASLRRRLECSGAPVALKVVCGILSLGEASTQAKLNFMRDGVTIDGDASQQVISGFDPANSWVKRVTHEWVDLAPPPGSHIYSVAAAATTATGVRFYVSPQTPALFTAEEDMRPTGDAGA